MLVGVLLLRQADRLLGLSDAIAAALPDPRRQASCDHDVHTPLRQRLYAITPGYEDLNDHEVLRQDVGLQTAVERDRSLAYTLIETIRRIALKGTQLANAYIGTIRLKLFKIGAVILKNTRWIPLFRGFAALDHVAIEARPVRIMATGGDSRHIESRA